jgi:hypothetical protein
VNKNNMDNAKIILIGQPKSSLLAEIESIKKWDGGHNFPIKAAISNDVYVIDSISNVEEAIKNDLMEYLERNFNKKGKMLLKSGHEDDLYLVPDYDVFEDNHFHKIRHKSTNITPPKKKRKK